MYWHARDGQMLMTDRVNGNTKNRNTQTTTTKTPISHIPSQYINSRLSIFRRLMDCTLLYCFIAHIAFLILCARKISVYVRFNRLCYLFDAIGEKNIILATAQKYDLNQMNNCSENFSCPIFFPVSHKISQFKHTALAE